MSTTTLPTNSHFISLEQGVEMTSLYRAEKEAILATPFQNQNILPNSETFKRDDIDTLLAQEGCAGLRIYYGMKESLQVHAIMVAVNSSNEDILPESESLVEEGGDIVEEGQRCPDFCPPPSPLNEDE
jgi:hypothetical protein